MAAAVPQHYNDGNRAFLQAFMARGTMTFEEARPVLAAIFTLDENEDVSEQQVTREDFESYVAAASQAISFFDYEIRSTFHQATKEHVYALVNTTSDPMTQLATTFTPDELSFVKRLLDAICETHNTPRMEMLCISGMDATKLGRPKKPSNADGDAQQTQSQAPDKGLKHSEVEQMLYKLVSQGWLEQSREGYYSLTPRSLMELRTWLIDSYNDPDLGPEEWQRIKFCKACKDIVTHGKRCAERDCTFRIHDTCEDAYWRTQRERKCPQCSKEWQGSHFVGERALTNTEAYQRGRRKSGGGQAGRRSNAADEAGEEDEEDSE